MLEVAFATRVDDTMPSLKFLKSEN